MKRLFIISLEINRTYIVIKVNGNGKENVLFVIIVLIIEVKIRTKEPITTQNFDDVNFINFNIAVNVH